MVGLQLQTQAYSQSAATKLKPVTYGTTVLLVVFNYPIKSPFTLFN